MTAVTAAASPAARKAPMHRTTRFVFERCASTLGRPAARPVHVEQSAAELELRPAGGRLALPKHDVSSARGLGGAAEAGLLAESGDRGFQWVVLKGLCVHRVAPVEGGLSRCRASRVRNARSVGPARDRGYG